MPSLSTFPENKSSLHHLSEVLPQYLSVSCSMKLWRCLALSLIFWETKKCYFSRTLEGEKRRGANDCLSGSVLDPAIIRSALMARLRRAYRPISPNLNFTRAALLSPAALLWLLFFFLLFWASFTNYQFFHPSLQFYIRKLPNKTKTLPDLRPKWQWTDFW